MKLFRGRKITRIKVASIVLALITILIPITIWAAGGDQTSNADIVRSLSLSYKLKGTTDFVELQSPYEIADSSKLESMHANYRFDLNDNIDPDTGEPNRTVHEGDYYLIDLPVEVQFTGTPSGGSIVDMDDNVSVIANYTFVQQPDDSWQIKVEFTDYVDDINRFDIYGTIEFDFSFDLTSVPEGTTTTISIPISSTATLDIEITKPVPPVTTPVSLTKTITSYNNQTRQLVWNVKMMPDNGVFSGCVFTDIIDLNYLELVSVKHGAVDLVAGVDYIYDNMTGEIEYSIPEGRDGTSFQNIIITTSVKRSVYGTLTPINITNQANLSGGDEFVDIDSNTATQTITPNWLTKSGTIYEGNRILWTINANVTNQAMYNGVVTDHLAADVVLDETSVKVDGVTISVHALAENYVPVDDAEIYGVYLLNGDSTAELSIYLPRGVGNVSNSTRIITLVTDVVEPIIVPGTDPVYNNSASLIGKFITDGDGEGDIPEVNLNQTGVAVPVAAIDKYHTTLTADDKRNGTIVWNISAVSNLSDYGKSQIIDTLPSDQSYIADEIYWGSTKIDENSIGAKAVISGDGRTLTITFDDDNALSTQQFFTVKTVIDPEIYGQNLNRNFTNQAQVILFEDVVGSTQLDTATDSDSIAIQNTVIAKSVAVYNGNTTKQAQNPRVNFSIVVNSNLMPLNNVVVSDDISRIVTEFKPSGGSFSTVNGVNWNYVPGSITITKNSGSLDSLDLTEIAANATYINDILVVDFGTGVNVNDKYTITFTAELDVAQDDIFKQNGTIRCRGNIGEVVAGGLMTGIVSSPATGNSSEIKNEILGKTGTHSVAEQQAVWTININQHEVAMDIPSGYDNPQIVDILPVGLTLDPTSIKLYTDVIGTNGNFVTGSNVETQGVEVPIQSYTYAPATGTGNEGKYVLTVELPDNQKAYTLRFSTDISGSILGTQVSNSAYYVGESSTQVNTNTTTVSFSSTSGGGSTLKTSLTINKYDKDTGEALNGSVFALYWLKNGTEPIFVRNLTVADGIVKFSGLARGEEYTVTEISAPSGYIVDSDEPIQFTAPGTGEATPINFYNTPTKAGNWIPKAIKNLDGRSIEIPFNFVITEGSDEIMNGVTTDEVGNGDFNVEFTMSDSISPIGITDFTDSHIFDLSDPDGTEFLVTTKNFEMTEVYEALAGYEFDPSVHNLVVKVYNVKGQSYLKVVIEDEDGNVLSDENGNFTTEETPFFSNIYRAEGSVLINAKKTLNCKTVKKDFFTFELQQFDLDSGEAIGDSVITKNRTGGDVIFPLIEYTQADAGEEFYYHISEVDTGRPGFICDQTVFTVHVSVVDNGDGTVSSTKEILEPEEQTDIVFENIYDPLGTELEFKFKKVIDPLLLLTQNYRYFLKETDKDRNITKEIQETGNNVTGQVEFDEIKYSKTDIGKTFYYTIYELNEDKNGYIYDIAIYYIIVNVVDDCDGVITTDVTKIKSVNGREAVILGEIEFSEPEPLTADSFPVFNYSLLALISLSTILFFGRKRIKE